MHEVLENIGKMGDARDKGNTQQMGMKIACIYFAGEHNHARGISMTSTTGSS